MLGMAALNFGWSSSRELPFQRRPFEVAERATGNSTRYTCWAGTH